MAKGMRVKEMGATINLGQYSSLHVTIGEESEFAGLDIAKGQKYLKAIAASVGGTLNLPDLPEKKKATKATKVQQEPQMTGERLFCFSGSGEINYDHSSHTYFNNQGVKYRSVTQLVAEFYPFDAEGKIAQAYMDFAASFGNLIHTAIQNSVIGKKPKKTLVTGVVDDVLEAMGDYGKAVVEQPLSYPEQELAGRFDIYTRGEKNVLWDVKTNSDLYSKANCKLPDQLREEFGKYWNVDTIYGEHCLQLNIYAWIIEHTTEEKVDEIKIIHVPDKFNEIIDVPKVDISKIFDAYSRNR